MDETIGSLQERIVPDIRVKVARRGLGVAIPSVKSRPTTGLPDTVVTVSPDF
jgi:hypothetical protein